MRLKYSQYLHPFVLPGLLTTKYCNTNHQGSREDITEINIPRINSYSVL